MLDTLHDPSAGDPPVDINDALTVLRSTARTLERFFPTSFQGDAVPRSPSSVSDHHELDQQYEKDPVTPIAELLRLASSVTEGDHAALQEHQRAGHDAGCEVAATSDERNSFKKQCCLEVERQATELQIQRQKEHDQELATLRSELQLCTSQLHAANTSLVTTNQENSRLKAQQNDQLQTLLRDSTELEKYRARMEAVVGEMDGLRQDAVVWKDHLSGMKATRSVFDGKVEEMLSTNKSLAAAVVRLAGEVEEGNGTKEQLSEDLKRLRAECTETREAKQAATAALETAHSRLNAALEAATQSTAALDDVSAQLSSSRAREQILEDTVAKLHAQLGSHTTINKTSLPEEEVADENTNVSSPTNDDDGDTSLHDSSMQPSFIEHLLQAAEATVDEKLLASSSSSSFTSLPTIAVPHAHLSNGPTGFDSTIVDLSSAMRTLLKHITIGDLDAFLCTPLCRAAGLSQPDRTSGEGEQPHLPSGVDLPTADGGSAVEIFRKLLHSVDLQLAESGRGEQIYRLTHERDQLQTQLALLASDKALQWGTSQELEAKLTVVEAEMRAGAALLNVAEQRVSEVEASQSALLEQTKKVSMERDSLELQINELERALEGVLIGAERKRTTSVRTGPSERRATTSTTAGLQPKVSGTKGAPSEGAARGGNKRSRSVSFAPVDSETAVGSGTCAAGGVSSSTSSRQPPRAAQSAAPMCSVCQTKIIGLTPVNCATCQRVFHSGCVASSVSNFRCTACRKQK